MNERKLSKSELAKREDIILNMKANKRDLVKKYGADAEKVMYGRATNMAKKQSESMNQTNVKLKEMVKDALKNPKKADLNKDGKLSDYEETRGKAVEKNLSEYKDEDVVKYKGEDHVITRRDGDRIYLRRKEDAAVLGRMPEFWVKSQDISEDLGYGFPEENPADIEDYELEDEDMDNPDEDLVIIGSGYLDIKSKFKGRPNMTNGELAIIGQKVVDKLHNGDKEAALDYIMGQINEDLDLGHEDNEPHMLKADLYRIGKYAMELYNVVDGFEGEGEVDFPSWWQAKITNAKTAIVGAKHYLDFEINEPKIDAVVDTIDDITPDDDAVDTDVLDVDIDEAQLGTDDDTGFTRSLYTPNEMGDASVGGEYASGAFEESKKPIKETMNMDKWRRAYNGKMFASKIVYLEDYNGNKSRYRIGFKYKETPSQDVVSLSESLFGGHEGSGINFAISNLQNNPTRLFTSDDIYMWDDETEFDAFIATGSKGLDEILEFFLGNKQIDKAIMEWFNTGVTDKSKIRIGEAKYNTVNESTSKHSSLAEKLAKELKEGLPKDFWDKKMKAKDEVNDEQDGIGDGLAEVDLPKSLLQKMNNQVKSPSTFADTILNLINAIQAKEPVDFGKNQKMKKVITILNDLKGDVELEPAEDAVEESYNTLVNKIEKSGKSEKAAKAIAGAVASYKAKGGGKGPTAKQK